MVAALEPVQEVLHATVSPVLSWQQLGACVSVHCDESLQSASVLGGWQDAVGSWQVAPPLRMLEQHP